MFEVVCKVDHSLGRKILRRGSQLLRPLATICSNAGYGCFISLYCTIGFFFFFHKTKEGPSIAITTFRSMPGVTWVGFSIHQFCELPHNFNDDFRFAKPTNLFSLPISFFPMTAMVHDCKGGVRIPGSRLISSDLHELKAL
jgi:hypothetical protein